MTETRGDDLVADYLERVRAAAAGLDPGRRDELVEDLREHIATARAELTPETEAGVRAVLDRLGDPAAIVAEASAGEPPALPPVVDEGRGNRTALTILVTVLAALVLAPIIVCVVGVALFRVASDETESPQPGPVESHVPAPSSRASAISAGPAAGIVWRR